MASTPAPPLASSNENWHRTQLATSLGLALQGHLNNTLLVTLTTGTQTIVTDARVGSQTAALAMPQTADAAAALPGLWSVCATGVLTINHAAGAADRSFMFAFLG